MTLRSPGRLHCKQVGDELYYHLRKDTKVRNILSLALYCAMHLYEK